MLWWFGARGRFVGFPGPRLSRKNKIRAMSRDGNRKGSQSPLSQGRELKIGGQTDQGYGPRTSCPRETSARAAADVIRTPSGATAWSRCYAWSVCASCGRVSGWADYD